MEFICKDCSQNIAWRCSTLPEMLEHHFQAHEKYVPQSALERVDSEETIIGFTNKRTWVDLKGDIHNISCLTEMHSKENPNATP